MDCIRNEEIEITEDVKNWLKRRAEMEKENKPKSSLVCKREDSIRRDLRTSHTSKQNMQFKVGQKIFGRSGEYRNTSDGALGKIEEYIIDRVGTKYLYVRKEDWLSEASFPVCKETLWSKESCRNIRFFSSIQDMQEHDEEELLFRELRMTFMSPNRVHKFGVEKLRAIKALLDGSNNLVLISDFHSLILADEEKDTMDAILTMGLERVNPDRHPEVMVHSVIYKFLNTK